MLNASDIAFIKTQQALVAPDLEQAITYQPWAGETGGNKDLGIPATELQRSDVAMTAIVHPLTAEEVQAAGGVYAIGDYTFGVRRDSVDARDHIVYQGVTWQIVEMYKAILAGETLTWWLRCKRA